MLSGRLVRRQHERDQRVFDREDVGILGIKTAHASEARYMGDESRLHISRNRPLQGPRLQQRPVQPSVTLIQPAMTHAQASAAGASYILQEALRENALGPVDQDVPGLMKLYLSQKGSCDKLAMCFLNGTLITNSRFGCGA